MGPQEPSSCGLGTRIRVEAATLEVDRRLVVLSIPIAAGHQLDRLGLAVDPLGRGGGDPERAAGQKVRQLPLERLSLLDDGGQTRVGGPEVPRAEVLRGALQVDVVPEAPERLFDRPGATGLEVRVLHGLELRAAPFRGPVSVPGPEVPRAFQPEVVHRRRCPARRAGERGASCLLHPEIDALGRRVHGGPGDAPRGGDPQQLRERFAVVHRVVSSRARDDITAGSRVAMALLDHPVHLGVAHTRSGRACFLSRSFAFDARIGDDFGPLVDLCIDQLPGLDRCV
jgi:hypothetical protein